MYDPMYDGIPKNVSVGPQLRSFINDVKPRLKDDEVFIMRCWNNGSGGMSIVKEVDAYGSPNPFSVNEYDFFVVEDEEVV